MTPPATTRDELLGQLRELRERALTDVHGAAQLSRDADAHLADAVRRARDAGASWADIGSATGITRQSAQQKWGAR